MMLRVLLALLLFAAVGLGGCKKEEPTMQEQMDQMKEEAEKTAEDMADEAEEAADEAQEAVEDNM